MKKEIEKRALKIEFRATKDDTGKVTLAGSPIVYGKRSDDMGFIEIIKPGAATEALKISDARVLWNHDSNTLPIGRMSAGGMSVNEDKNGVHIELNDLPSYADDLVEAIDRNIVQDMSFGFTVQDDIWETIDGKDVRTITKIGELFDFSFVAFPAYPDTTVALRNLETFRNNGVNADEISVTAENEDIELELLIANIGGQ